MMCGYLLHLANMQPVSDQSYYALGEVYNIRLFIFEGTTLHVIWLETDIKQKLELKVDTT